MPTFIFHFAFAFIAFFVSSELRASTELKERALNVAAARLSEKTAESLLKLEAPDRTRVWVFLSAKCPCSHSHIEKLKATYLELQKDEKGHLDFVGIHSNLDESVEEARRYFMDQDLPFPVFHDPGAKIADHFKALKTPHVFVESIKQEILFQGGIDSSANASKRPHENFLLTALLEIKTGKPISKSKMRALGCVISRKK